MLLLRDANWWPDFPTSARAVTNLYEQDTGGKVDGVVAVDLFTLELLLRALGPVQVPGYDETISSSNLESMIMTYWEAPLQTAPGREVTDWWLHRKDLAADLLSAIVERLSQDLTTQEAVTIGRALATAARQGHLQLYLGDAAGQELVTSLGLDGSIPASAGDYLQVVDSNVGFNKVNPNIDQSIDYSVIVDDSGKALAQLHLTYRHKVDSPMPACVHQSYYGQGYRDLMERCYWDYVRIYVPGGSQVLGVEGADEPVEVYDEAGKTVIATSFLLENGQTRTLQIRYRPNLAAPAEDGYLLMVQKQGGSVAPALRVRISPPEGRSITAGSPDDLVATDAGVAWQGHLTHDRTFRLSWE
jgi:hypothetical protein